MSTYQLQLPKKWLNENKLETQNSEIGHFTIIKTINWMKIPAAVCWVTALITSPCWVNGGTTAPPQYQLAVIHYKHITNINKYK